MRERFGGFVVAGLFVAALAVASTGCGAGGTGAGGCAEPLRSCGERCVDPRNDPANCGACAHACDAGSFCAAGACTAACPEGTVDCDGACVDPLRDPLHCGGCGNECDGNEACSNGACVAVCADGETRCDGGCVDLARDDRNCGRCGNACDGDQSCVDGACWPEGTGGTGGGGGDGGAGGAGGSGGAPPACVPACNEGETCETMGTRGVCRCDPDPETCPVGQFCNDQLRCEAEPQVTEFTACGSVDEIYEAPDGARFYCTDYLADTGLWWLRMCENPDECVGANTFCLGSLFGFDRVPFCYFNFCGPTSIGPQLQPPLPGNGETFGPCSSRDGYLAAGATPDGTCVPMTFGDGSLGGLCMKTGTAPKDGECRLDATKAETDRQCVPDAQCLSYLADEPLRPCTSDAGCETVPVTIDRVTVELPGYCARTGFCEPLGFCGDVCNAGTSGAGVHANAGCTDPTGTCVNLSGRAGSVREGYCVSTCTMFEPGACPAYPEGQPRTCYPSFDTAAPLEGTCIPRAATTKSLGDDCDPTLPATECPDDTACLSLPPGAPATCVAFCACPTGFDGTTALCTDPAVHEACAPAGTVCAAKLPGSPIGVCVVE